MQAVLPLRGKILNIERRDEAAMYKNEEIQNLILALGLGVKGEDFKKEALHYHKIIILTDADVDGAHIRTLLLTFFFRYQRALFDEGYIYVGVPPLYKVERGNQAYYCYDEADLKRLQGSFPPNASYNIQRFKGLGEMMPLQLWETTLDPERRLLKQLVVEDAAEANVVFSSLMGSRAFLNRLVREHGSIDLEWLRDVPPDKVKEYLLSVRGLGLKSVECVRLLTLHHLAFPVDTNVGRIAVRLGWVPLQPLPESLQLHLLELYPVLESIQRYLWPRLCKLDQRTLKCQTVSKIGAGD